MKKNNIDKILAKIVYYSVTSIAIFAGIILTATFGAMIEAMEISRVHFIISSVCTALIGMYALFIYFLERK